MIANFIAILVIAFGITSSTSGSVDSLLEFKAGLANSDALHDWIVGSSPCARNWTGISCSPAGEIVSISLSAAGLIGPIAAAKALVALPALEKLDLSSNSLSGSIPPRIWEMPSVQRLDLSHNLLQGSIDSSSSSSPPALTRSSVLPLVLPPKLEQLDLSSNSLSGSIDLCDFLLQGQLQRIDLSSNSFSILVNRACPSPPDHHRLEELVLAANSFSGHIPGSISSLTALRRLDLSSNLLSGSIPFDLFPPSLQILDVSNNSFSGSIDPSVSRLSSLIDLSIGQNPSLTGSIPSSIASLSKLEVLYAASCKLSGPIPPLPPSLRKLDLSTNALQSSIPDSIGDLAQLQSISIASAQLNGSIPASLGRCSRLELVNLAFNQLSGPLPDDLAALDRIITFTVAGNALSGGIPSWIGRWQRADSILLSTNAFTGGIPPELGQCRQVTDLGLDNNQLTGGIPPELCDAGLLSQLTLDHNALTGSLAALKRCANLTELDVTGNTLSGKIPRDLLDLEKLVILDISGNFFSGSIPDELWNATQLMEIFANDNLLEGELSPLVGKMENLQHLYLDGNRLRGPLPKELGLLKSLTVLSLAENEFDGEIPREAFATTSGLTTLDLGSNRLTGAIPADIGKLVGLDCLVLSHNRLSGQIPSEVTRLFQVEVPPESGFVQHHGVLDLSFNSLTGGIPSDIGQCSVLVELDLSNNLLQGRIPPEIAVLSNLTTLDLSNNLIRGSIPWQLGQNTKLQGLNLGYNRLTGHIPPELGSLERLVKLNVSHNHLTGSIPDHLGQLSGLSHLDASSNALTGSLPPSFSRMASIVGLFLQENSLTGGIDGLLSNSFQWRQAQTLNLSYNALAGDLPRSIGNLTGLSYLDLRRNSLTGEIPAEIGSIVQLVYLDLSENKLVGEIPGSLCELTELGFFNVSDNSLTGDIPHGGICRNFSRSSYGGNGGLCDSTVVSCESGDSRSSSRQPGILHPGAVLAIAIASMVAFFGLVLLVIRWRMARQQSETLLVEKIKLNGGNVASIGSSSSSPFSSDRDGHSSSSSSGFSCLKSVIIATPNTVHTGKVTASATDSSSREPLSINVAMFERPLLRLTLSDIVAATNGFSKANVIGDGGYGTVYRAVLPDGRTVAVKKLAPVRDYRAVSGGSNSREFLAEMETLGKVKHRNLVTLLGYCSYGEERLLVYDYMVNGSLDVWLRNRTDALEVLTWDRRLRIALGAARGLAFLHHGIVPHVIHRDVKASNILLDAEFEPRVADFGLARLISAYDTHVSTDIAGTFGYIPPEYGMTWRATSRGDVYSYGVILLELVTGKEPTGPDFKDADIGNLVGWVRSMVKQGKSDEVLDVAVATQSTWKASMLQVLHIAMLCTADEPMKRPAMVEVVRQLKEIES